MDFSKMFYFRFLRFWLHFWTFLFFFFFKVFSGGYQYFRFKLKHFTLWPQNMDSLIFKKPLTALYMLLKDDINCCDKISIEIYELLWLAGCLIVALSCYSAVQRLPIKGSFILLFKGGYKSCILTIWYYYLKVSCW